AKACRRGCRAWRRRRRAVRRTRPRPRYPAAERRWAWGAGSWLVLQSQSLEAFVHVPTGGLLGGVHHGGDLGVRSVGDVTERERGPLLGGKLADLDPHAVVVSGRARYRPFGHVLDRHRFAPAHAKLIDRLAVGDREH